MTLSLAFLIGVLAGLRSLTAPAVVAWAASRQAEVRGRARPDRLDDISRNPDDACRWRIDRRQVAQDAEPNGAPVGLGARIVTGGLTGACIAAAGGTPNSWDAAGRGGRHRRRIWRL